MRMKIFQWLIIVVVACTACTTEREAPNGLKVKVLTRGSGDYAKPGEFLVTSMIIKDSKDSIWRDTRIQDLPMILPVGAETSISRETGVESAFRVMKIGDSVSVDIPAKTLFKEEPLPPSVKPDDLVTFVFCVKDITDQRGVMTIQQGLQAKQAEQSRKMQEGQLSRDTVAIDAYLAAKKINAIKDVSGMRYVIKKLGNGPKPVLTSIVKFTYKGSLMDNGFVFEASEKPVDYPLNNLIVGWQICFQLFPKGTSATLYVPSPLGYGTIGSQPGIPPNANLIFEVELVDFKDM